MRELLWEQEMGQSSQQGAAKALTAVFLATDLAPGKYHDGGNSRLIHMVKANGSRFWVQRLTVKGKRTDIGLGDFPTVRRTDARAKAQRTSA